MSSSFYSAVGIRYLTWAGQRGLFAVRQVVFARLFGPETLGEWVVALAVATACSAGANFVVRENLLRSASADPGEERTAFAAVLGAMALSLPAAAVLLLLAGLALGPRFDPVLVVTLLFLNLGFAANFTSLRAERALRLRLLQVPALVMEAATLLVTLALHVGAGLELGALYGGALAGFVAQAIAVAVLFGPPPRPRFEPRGMRSYLRYGAPAALYGILNAITLGSVPVLLAAFHHPADAALYAAAFAVVSAAYAALAVLEASYYPLFTEAVREGDRARLSDLFVRSSRQFAVIGYAASGTLFFCADLVAALFGPGWEALELLIRIGSVQFAFRLASGYLYGHLTFATAQTHRMIGWSLLDLALLATLGAAMIARWGAVGAMGYQAVQAALLIPLIRLPAIRSALGSLAVYRSLWRPALAFSLAAVAAGACAASLPRLGAPAFLLLFFALLLWLDADARRLLALVLARIQAR